MFGQGYPPRIVKHPRNRLRDSFSGTLHLVAREHCNTETHSEKFQDIRFENSTILRANTMIRIFCHQGVRIEDVVFRNIHTEELSRFVASGNDEFRRIAEIPNGVTYLVQMLVRKQPQMPLGSIADVLFESVHANVPAGSKIKGYDTPKSTILIRDVTFRDLRLGGQIICNSTDGRFNINDNVKNVCFEE